MALASLARNGQPNFAQPQGKCSPAPSVAEEGIGN